MLTIRVNDRHFVQQCPRCGESNDVIPGPELYDATAKLAVCWECGAKESPTLVALLTLGQAADTYSHHLVNGDHEGDTWEAQCQEYQEKLFRTANYLAFTMIPEGPERQTFAMVFSILGTTAVIALPNPVKQRFDSLLQGVDLDGVGPK